MKKTTNQDSFAQEDWPKRSKLVLDWQEEMQKVQKELLLLKGPFLALGFQGFLDPKMRIKWVMP